MHLQNFKIFVCKSQTMLWVKFKVWMTMKLLLLFCSEGQEMMHAFGRHLPIHFSFMTSLAGMYSSKHKDVYYSYNITKDISDFQVLFRKCSSIAGIKFKWITDLCFRFVTYFDFKVRKIKLWYHSSSLIEMANI